jgi:hypothetical protein
MQQDQKKLAREELEKIYDSRFKWLQAGKVLRGRFAQSLNDNPKLNLTLKGVLAANIGIWLAVLLLVNLTYFG